MTFTKEDLEYGSYFLREDVEKACPAIVAEWDAWLSKDIDPGTYEVYKDRTKHPPEWKVEIFMPGPLVRKMKALLEGEDVV